MILDDDQVLIHVDERVTIYVKHSHGLTEDRVQIGIYVPGANVTAHMAPKVAREVSAALLAFAGADS